MTTERTSARAFYNVDRDLRFTSANAAALAIWGKSHDEVLGKSLLEVFPQVARTAAYEAHLEALKSLRPYHGDLASSVLGRHIQLEIYPSATGLRVSFLVSP